MPKIIPDERARQGAPGRPVLGVLVGALALCGIALVAWFLWAVYGAPADNRHPTASTASSAVSSSSPSNPTLNTPAANPAYPVPAEPNATGSTKR